MATHLDFGMVKVVLCQQNTQMHKFSTGWKFAQCHVNMKFCLLENKKVAWYQRLCKPLFWKGGKNVYCIISCVLWYHVQFESNFIVSLVSCVAVSSPVTCLHLSWWDLTVMQIITPCVATKLIVCYLLQMLFLSLLTLWLLKTFLLHSSTATSLYMYLAFSLSCRDSDISHGHGAAKFRQICKIPQNSREIGWFFLEFVPKNPAIYDFFFHDLSKALFMVEHFYNQTGKTVNIRNISGMLLCCKIKANWAWETKLQARILISFCGFVASWHALIFAVIGRNTINIPEIF